MKRKVGNSITHSHDVTWTLDSFTNVTRHNGHTAKRKVGLVITEIISRKIYHLEKKPQKIHTRINVECNGKTESPN